MLIATLAFSSAVILALLFTPLAGHLARCMGAIDVADSLRKVHGRPVPRMGGLAIVGGAVVAAAAAVTIGGAGAGDQRPLGLALGALMVVMLGLFDDVRGTGASTKLLVQAAAAVVAWSSGFDLDWIWTPFGVLALGAFDLPLTVLWIVGVTNAVNLVDGLDGLAAGLAAIAGAALAVLAIGRGDLFVGLAAAATAGASLGFLWWNRHPASIFMGDTGSLFLGFVLAVLSLPSHGADGTPLLPAVLVMAIPVGDTLLAIVRRTARGVPVHLGDRGHLHHRLLALGHSPRGAAIALHLAGAGCAVGGLALAATSGVAGIGLLFIFATAVVVGLRALGMRPLGTLRTLVAERRRNLALRRLVRHAALDLASANDPQAIWSALRTAGVALGASRAEVIPCGDPVAPLEVGTAGDRISRHALAPGRGSAPALVLVWGSTGDVLDRDREIAVEQLCGQAVRALRRVERQASPAFAWWLVPVVRRSQPAAANLTRTPSATT